MTTKPRILIHNHAFAYEENGKIWVQAYIGQWVNHLANHFSLVGLLLFISQKKLPKQDTPIIKDNITLHIMGEVREGRRQSKISLAKEMCRRVSGQYDILLIRGVTPRQMLVYKYCNIPIKAFLLVGSIKESKPSLSFHWMSFFIMYRYYLRNFEIKQFAKDGIIYANSPQIVKELRKELQIDSFFIPTNAISIKDFIPFKFASFNDPVEILFCGRVVIDKGIEELIDAIGKLKKRGIATTLKIVGIISNTYRKHLEKLANNYAVIDQISFEGFIPFGEQLLGYYKKTDIYILPSWHEGFPHTIWEASANCTTIITTKVGGIPGFVSEEELYFIQMKNSDSIVDTVEHVLKHEQEAKEKALKAYNLALSYSVESCAKKLYQALV